MKEHVQPNDQVDLSTRKGGFLYAPHVEGRQPAIYHEDPAYYTPGHVAGCRCGPCKALRLPPEAW